MKFLIAEVSFGVKRVQRAIDEMREYQVAIRVHVYGVYDTHKYNKILN